MPLAFSDAFAAPFADADAPSDERDSPVDGSLLPDEASRAAEAPPDVAVPLAGVEPPPADESLLAQDSPAGAALPPLQLLVVATTGLIAAGIVLSASSKPFSDVKVTV